MTPFLKWAGGKSQLLPELLQRLPAEIDDYVEPFLGGAAVFFCLRGCGRLRGEVTLSDVNPELVNAYEVVRDRVDDLLEVLQRHKGAHCREHYYEVRARAFRRGVQGAARTLYLNRTGFNGLYRVNRQGHFNVPMGDYVNPRIRDEEGLRRCSEALQGARLLTQCFRDTILQARPGAVLYVDPPYVPLTVTSSFTGYIPGGFGPADQADLARTLAEADSRGLRFVLSNSYTESVCALYEGFRLDRVPARRAINCKATGRGAVDEAIVSNFAPAPAPEGA